MAKIDLETTSSSYQSTASINRNTEAIEAEFQNKVLYRDNPDGEPNQMENALDMNSNQIINLPSAVGTGQPVTYEQWTASSLSPTVSFIATTREKIIATAGQTVINLTNPYVPGSNNLSFYLNGVLQTGNYLETDGTTVTMISGYELALNDEVVIIVNERTVAADVVAASSVTFNSVSGASNVQDDLLAAQTKLQDTPYLRDYGAEGDGVSDDSAETLLAITTAPVGITNEEYNLSGTPIDVDYDTVSDVRIDLNGSTVIQTGQAVAALRFASVDASKRLTDGGVTNTKFTQEKQTAFVNNNNSAYKTLAAIRPRFVGNYGDVDIVVSYGYGYTPDGASATQSCEYGIIALNSFSFKTMGVELLGSAHGVVVGNVMAGDAGAFQNCYRISGYAGAPAHNNVFAGNSSNGGNHILSVQKTAKFNSVVGLSGKDTSGDAVEFTDIVGEPGTVAQNLPEYNYLGGITIDGGPKALYLNGGEKNVVDIVAAGQSGNAVETTAEPSGGTGNDNTIRARIDASGGRSVNILTDDNTIDVQVVDSTDISVNIAGDYNNGRVKIRGGSSSGLNFSGTNNYIDAHIRDCTGTELTFNGDNNIVTGFVDGDITFNGNDNLFIGRCTGSITESGLRNAVQSDQVSTTTLLTSSTSDVNTKGKFRGVKVFNQNTNKTVFAAGEGATATWRTSDGTIEHTPV